MLVKPKETAVDRLMKTIEKNNHEMLLSIKETERLVAKSMDEIISTNTKNITECFDREIDKMRKAEEETEGQIVSDNLRMKEDVSKARAQTEFLLNQNARNKKVVEIFRFNHDSTAFQNSKHISSLQAQKTAREHEHNLRMSELSRKLHVLEDTREKYEFFTELSIDKVGEEDLIRFNFRNVSDLQSNQTAFVCLKHFKDTLIGSRCSPVSDIAPRVKDFFEISQVLTVLKDLKLFIQLMRRSFKEHFDSPSFTSQ